MGEKRKIKLTDDHFFKHLMINSQNIRTLLCQKLIGDDIKLQSTTILNTELDTDHSDSKAHILDILAIDQYKNQYNIEMQCTPVNENNFKRFLVYGYKLVFTSLSKGKSYSDLKPVYQLIINASGKDIDAFHHYEHIIESYDENGTKVSNNYTLLHMHLIQLHHIDELGDIINQDDFDKVMYTFKYGVKNDIISSSETVREMVEMFESYIDSETLRQINEERDMFWQNTLEEEAEKRGLNRGLAKGMAKGIAKGMAKGKAEGKVEGIVEGKLEAYIELYKEGILSFEQLKEYSSLSDEQLNERI